jgi:hypothetical protein
MIVGSLAYHNRGSGGLFFISTVKVSFRFLPFCNTLGILPLLFYALTFCG